MKLAKPILFLCILLLAFSSCSSAEKAAIERRNLMMPEKGDLQRNSTNFNSSSKKKKPKHKQKNKKKKYKKKKHKKYKG